MSERASPTVYSALRREKPSADELVLARGRDPLAQRKRPDVSDPRAEVLDEAVADRDSGEERHLLGRDRADEHLEGIGRKRRAKALEPASRRAEHVVGGRPRIERVEVEREPEHRSHDGLRLCIERLDVDSTGRRLDPHFAAADGAVEPAFVPHRRLIDPERAKALGGEREIEWPGHGEERHARTVSGAQPFEPAAA